MIASVQKNQFPESDLLKIGHIEVGTHRRH